MMKNLMVMMARRDEPPPLEGGGSGRSLPLPLLATAAACSIFATLLSIYSIVRQLNAYYKPALQRYTVRILVMVPIYAVASLTSLFSLNSAFVVDVMRDLYEAVTLLSLFNLMIAYLGGERSILVLAHGRKPVPHPWPVRLFYPPLDVSNPHTFLSIKRGVLQYVQIKPVLAVAAIATKLTGTYHEGKLGLNYYTAEQIIYNFSVFLSLYCLAMFWSCLSPDLASFRVTPKFICIKGIIFFSFWQGLAVSIIVAFKWVTRIGPVADPQYLSIAITDVLICLEMPFFAIGHLYAFSPSDYLEKSSYYQARLPAKYALRDAIGIYDMMADAVDTIKGGMRHRYSELSTPTGEKGSDDKIRSSGMKYTDGRKHSGSGHSTPASSWTSGPVAFLRAPFSSVRSWSRRRHMEREGYAALLPNELEADEERIRREADADLEQGKSQGVAQSSKHKPGLGDDSDDSDDDDDELAVRLRGLAKEGMVGMLDFLTGQKFVHDHEGDLQSVVSCHFSLHEHERNNGDDASQASAVHCTEDLYEEARQLAREDVLFPGSRTGLQEEMLKKWIVDQQAALQAAKGTPEGRADGQEEEEGRVARAAAAASAAAASLPWAKRRRQREEELIGRMRTIREKKIAKRESRRQRREGDRRSLTREEGQGSARAISADGGEPSDANAGGGRTESKETRAAVKGKEKRQSSAQKDGAIPEAPTDKTSHDSSR
ncbi:unnamed protein product [Tilletia controversa]|nr:unnamed protein product [Tilletia controversa]